MPLRVRVQPNVLSLTRVQAVRHYIRRLLLDHRACEVKDIGICGNATASVCLHVYCRAKGCTGTRCSTSILVNERALKTTAAQAALLVYTCCARSCAVRDHDAVRHSRTCVRGRGC